MRQTRLNRYFEFPPTSNSPGPTLLDLSPSTRSLIYAQLVLVQDNHIHLNLPSAREEHIFFGKAARSPSTAYSLLLSCRTIYQEVCVTLYGEHHFCVSRHAPGGLSPLFNLGALAIASLVSLTISLHECRAVCQSLGGGHSCFYHCESCVELESSMKTKAIADSSRGQRALTREWEQLCKQMARFLQPSRLRLCFICDTDNYAIAQDFVQHLYYLPRLAACSIRLSVNSVPELRHLAASTTLQLVGQSNATSTFPSLPVELQTRILEYTDLVAPHDLEWSPSIGYTCHSPSHHTMNGQYRPSLSIRNPCELCFRVHQGCYCRMNHEGSFDSQCSCWRFPTAFFRVSREYKRIAIRIFYSRNHFNILYSEEHIGHRQPVMSFPPFSQRLRQEAVRFLRSLQFVNPRIISSHSTSEDASAQSWAESIQILGQYADLPRLVITIDKSRLREDINMYATQDEGDEYDRNAWARDQFLIGPLKQLHGLKDLFVHLASPKYVQASVELRDRKEKLLEQSVMGDHYDAIARGKFLNEDRWWHPT